MVESSPSTFHLAFIFPFLFCVDSFFNYAMSAAAEASGDTSPGEVRDASDVRPFYEVARARLVVNLAWVAIGQVHPNELEGGESNHPAPALDRNPPSSHLDDSES